MHIMYWDATVSPQRYTVAIRAVQEPLHLVSGWTGKDRRNRITNSGDDDDDGNGDGSGGGFVAKPLGMAIPGGGGTGVPQKR